MAGFDDRDGFIWVDGKFVDWRDAKVPMISHGFHYAGLVFEGIRAYNGEAFKLHEHSERLINSARLIDMKVPYSAEELDKATIETMAKNNLTDAYIRPIAWRGAEQMGITGQDTTIHTAIAVWEWPSYFSPELLEKGISLKTSKWKRPAPDTAPVHSKAAGLYMICTMSKHEAENAGYTDALMLDYRGYVAEATGANLFLMKDGKIHTPTPDCFLNGLTRQTVIELAKKRGIEVIERHIQPAELKDFDEIFITGTAAEVTAIGKIDDIEYKVGDITKLLRDDYNNLVNGRELQQAIA